MILAEPESAVSQPMPTPATSDAATNTAPKTPAPVPAVLRKDFTGDIGDLFSAIARSRS